MKENYYDCEGVNTCLRDDVKKKDKIEDKKKSLNKANETTHSELAEHVLDLLLIGINGSVYCILIIVAIIRLWATL